MAYPTKSIASRIEWCRQQSTQARTPREREGWQAEEEGLRDALFNRDHTTQYQQGPPGVFERYAMGLQDGHAALRTAAVYYQFVPPTRTAGTGDASTRRIRIVGLTRRAETDVHASRVTGNNKKIMGRVARHGVLPRYTEKNLQ
jgi:hypothetical protein